jgi:hypothetical protein
VSWRLGFLRSSFHHPSFIYIYIITLLAIASKIIKCKIIKKISNIKRNLKKSSFLNKVEIYNCATAVVTLLAIVFKIAKIPNIITESSFLQ